MASYADVLVQSLRHGGFRGLENQTTILAPSILSSNRQLVFLDLGLLCPPPTHREIAKPSFPLSRRRISHKRILCNRRARTGLSDINMLFEELSPAFEYCTAGPARPGRGGRRWC